MNVVIETTNLEKKYKSLTAVDNISVKIKKGELLSILGPNGAGKTTLIKMLTTVLKPTNGTALINNYDIQNNKQEIRKIIGVCPQDLVFYEELSAKENLKFFGQIFNLPKETLNTNIKDILNALGLAERNDKTKNFSGGMKRRLNFAISCIMNPDILFLDEPTAGLDPQSKRVVYNYIERLKAAGKTIILTTHDMHEAEILSDRIYIIDQGKIIAEGTPYQLKEQFGKADILEINFLDIETKNQAILLLERIDFIQEIKEINETDIVIHFNGSIKNFIKILNNQIFYGPSLEKIKTISLRQNSLEDVFLILTGRRLRD